jgi:hypothetical protein
MYKMFIDDEREPAQAGWTVVRTSADAIRMVQTRGWPSDISFDHDLGGDDTSMVFVRWAVDRMIDAGIGIPFHWYVHSQNPIGAANIDGLLNSYARSCLR